MAGITVASGKFAVYASTITDDSNPYAILKVAENGGACILQDKAGRIWIFYIVGSTGNKFDLRSYYSDNGGLTWSTSALVKADIFPGIPDAVETLSGRIAVYYFKTNLTNNPPTIPGTLKVLLVAPIGTINVGPGESTIGFVVANGGKDVAMDWSASASGHLSISGSTSGTEVEQDALMYRSYTENGGSTWTEEVNGIISFTVVSSANTGGARSGTVTVTATGATNSPVTVTINQSKGN
jgi:hypothetical protein